MKYLLDTNICIHIINHKPQQVIERFRKYHAGDIGISTISAAELAFGVARSGSARNREALEKFLAPIEIMPFDEEAFWRYGELRAMLEKKATPIGSLDTLIAAHALSLGVILVTHYIAEFACVKGLRCETWVTDQGAARK